MHSCRCFLARSWGTAEIFSVVLSSKKRSSVYGQPPQDKILYTQTVFYHTWGNMAKEYIDERKCSGLDCAWCATLDCIHSVMARVRKEVESDDTTIKDN